MIIVHCRVNLMRFLTNSPLLPDFAALSRCASPGDWLNRRKKRGTWLNRGQNRVMIKGQGTFGGLGPIATLVGHGWVWMAMRGTVGEVGGW